MVADDVIVGDAVGETDGEGVAVDDSVGLAVVVRV